MGSLPDSKYIIKTDGYWFVEAHDVDPSKGYISVSAKGIVNGLSNQPNDGCDFGPDSYNPNYSGSGIPYTQTSGLQEAVNYITPVWSEQNYNNGGPIITLIGGQYMVYDDVVIPSGYTQGDYIIDGLAYDHTNVEVGPGVNAFDFSNVSPDNIQIRNITFQHMGYVDGVSENPSSAVKFNYPTATTANLFFDNVFFDANNVDAHGKVLTNQAFTNGLIYGTNGGELMMKYCTFLVTTGNVFNCGVNNLLGVNIVSSGNLGSVTQARTVQFIDSTGSFDINAESASFVKINGNINAGPIVSTSTAVMELNGYLAAYGQPLTINTGGSIGYLSINGRIVQNNSSITSLISGTAAGAVYGLNLTNFKIDTPSTFDVTGYSVLSGTTAGTLYSRVMEFQSGEYLRIVVTGYNYVNDTTTNQTIGYNISNISNTSVTNNSTGLTVSSSTSGLTITAPNSTTVYNGIIIVEGF